MGVRRQRDPLGRIVEQPREATTYLVGFLEREIPDVVDMLGGIEPGLLLRLERHIGPRLMRVAGQQNPLGYAKATVMLGKLFGADHSSERIAQRSGKAGWLSVLMRYSAPADPPVPIFVPIVRCTIFTC